MMVLEKYSVPCRQIINVCRFTNEINLLETEVFLGLAFIYHNNCIPSLIIKSHICSVLNTTRIK